MLRPPPWLQPCLEPTIAGLQCTGGAWSQVMQRICREAEASLDYYSLFKSIMKRVPVPMSPLESLASSAVRTAHKVRLGQPRAPLPNLVKQKCIATWV